MKKSETYPVASDVICESTPSATGVSRRKFIKLSGATVAVAFAGFLPVKTAEAGRRKVTKWVYLLLAELVWELYDYFTGGDDDDGLKTKEESGVKVIIDLDACIQCGLCLDIIANKDDEERAEIELDHCPTGAITIE